MTNTAKTQTQDEAPLSWTSKSEWGSVGNTHRSTVALDNGDQWSFVVDQPRKGQWVARGWRKDREDVAAGRTGSGDMVFYREDRTMKGAKAQAQAQANLAQTSTCDECRKITGHKLDCSTGRAAAVAKDQARGTKLALRGTDEGALVLSSADTGRSVFVQDIMASVRQGMADMAPAVQQAARSFRSVWHAFRRPAGCSCPTPTHRMSCGAGGRVTVIPAGAFDGIPDHQYNELCPKTCCGGAE